MNLNTRLFICEDSAAKVGTEEVQQTGGADEFGFGDFPEQSEKPAKADSFEDDFGFGDQEQLQIQTADVEQTSSRDEFGSGGFPEQSERPAQAETADDAFGFENQEQTKPVSTIKTLSFPRMKIAKQILN